MKPKPFVLFFLFCLALGSMAVLPACAPSDKTAGQAADDVDYYTCAMHPSVRSHNPHDKCPICGMDLIPVLKKGHEAMPSNPAAASSDQPTVFTIPLDRQQLIGVTYTTVTSQSLETSLHVVGIVEAQKQLHWDVVTHIEGYVHTLKTFTPGDVVEKNQPLMDLYCPDFVAAQNELIDLLKMRDDAARAGTAATREKAEQLIASVRERLRRWEIPDDQIEAVEASREVQKYLTINSPAEGFLEALPVNQGQRVKVGDHLADVIDLSEVWVWAELYQDDLPLIGHEVVATVTVPSLPGVKYSGKVAIFDHHIDEMKRTARLGIDLDNRDLQLHPNMYVDVELPIEPRVVSAEAANAGLSSVPSTARMTHSGLIVPASAVLPTGRHNIVFVDKGGGKLEPRFVELGGQFGDVCLVINGLTEGERVVNSANFLVDSESKIQGALKSW